MLYSQYLKKSPTKSLSASSTDGWRVVSKGASLTPVLPL